MMRIGAAGTAKPTNSTLPTSVVAAWALVFFLVGASLRFEGVQRQFIGGDEWHTLHVASTADGYGEILKRYERRDNSVPLTLYARALMDTLGLTELRLRLPIMMSSLLLLLGPICFRKALGWLVALATLVLLSTSPLPVYYSIVVRPYSPASFLILISLYFWWKWLGEGSAYHWSFATAAAFAIFFHVLALFPVLVLFSLALAETVKGRLRLRRLLLAASVFGVICLGLFLPGLADLMHTRGTTIAAGSLSLEFLARVWRQLNGYLELTGWVLGLLILFGCVRLSRMDRLLGIAIPSILAIQILTLAVLRPVGTPSAWARYLFLVWPLALLAGAVGIYSIARSLSTVLPTPARKFSSQALTLILATALALTVPHASSVGLFTLPQSSFRSGKAMLHPTRAIEERGPEQSFPQLIAATKFDVIIVAPYRIPNTEWADLAVLERLYDVEFLMADLRVPRMRQEGIWLHKTVNLADEREIASRGADFLILDLQKASPTLIDTVRDSCGPPLARKGNNELYDIRL